jgi:uncharacterized membrane protein YtjA (UPF0391 family)
VWLTRDESGSAIRSGIRDATNCEQINRIRKSIFRSINHIPQERLPTMLRLALFFLVVSLVAALFGFGGISAASADIARILFFIAIVVFLVLLVAGLMAGSTLF